MSDKNELRLPLSLKVEAEGLLVVDVDGVMLFDCEPDDREAIESIITACNSHAALQAEVKRLQKILGDIQMHVGSAKNSFDADAGNYKVCYRMLINQVWDSLATTTPDESTEDKKEPK